MRKMEDLIGEWDGLGVVVRHDAASGSWFFVALHDATLGPPTGGCRMRIYDDPADGLLDALRLARGMTFKWAGIGLEVGGGKSVIALSRPLAGRERIETLRRFGRLLESLNGAYWGGEDLGTTPEDMATVAGETRYVHGIRPDGSVVDPGPYTARGVLAGIRGAADRVFGDGNLSDRSVLIQGVGDVGRPLAELLRAEGAQILLSDIDGDRAGTLAAELDARLVEPHEVYATPCDVFAPCAVGQILNGETIPRLNCRLVAGSANNQLRDEDADARALRDAGIEYLPDYIVNAGGAIALALLARDLPEAVILERIDGIAPRVAEILEEAERLGETPVEAARRRVARLLERDPA